MVEYESLLRISMFVGVLIIMALWENKTPRRDLSQLKQNRWLINLGLTIVDMAFVRFTLGAVAVSTAIHAQREGWGLLNSMEISSFWTFLLTIIIMDMAIYLQHVISHALPVFWRLHRVHHTDLDYDVTTGLRFHPIEILVSMIYKAALAAALGANPWGVVIFEIILNASSQFNHGNVDIPESMDRKLRLFVVTPDMHRVHHSWEIKETNSNFGFFLPWWDRLFGTYRDQPEEGHTDMTIGLKEYRDAKKLKLQDLLILPFKGPVGDYSLRKD